jgi:hypothetical protein
MNMEDYSNRVAEFQSKLAKMISSEASTIKDIIGGKPSRFNVEGVYVISDPDDREIVYVGKTVKKSIIGRLIDHRSTDTKSDLRGMLKLFLNYPREIDYYLVRCIEVIDQRERTFFEHFSISVIQPPFNK